MTIFVVLFAPSLEFEEKYLDFFSAKPETKTTKYFLILWCSSSILSPIMFHVSKIRDAPANKFRVFVLEASRYMVIMFFCIPIFLIILMIIGLASIGGGLGWG